MLGSRRHDHSERAGHAVTGRSHETRADTLQDLIAVVTDRHPTATLVPNDVKNLAIMVEGEFAGYIDLCNDEVEWTNLDL